MPKATSKGVPIKEELPSTVRRSPKKARKTFAKAHDAAAKEYGEGRRAHQTAYATLKRKFEKVGDHWEPKRGKSRQYPTAEGVDANASKSHLQGLAKRLNVAGRSEMNKSELVDAIKKANRRKSAASRGR